MPSIATFTKDPDSQLDFTIHWGAPAWLTATAYSAGDRVFDANKGTWHLCITGHTSSGATRSASDSAYWSAISDGMWLPAGDSISSVAWDVPSGLTEVSNSDDGYAATIWLSGGTAGESYEVRCRMTSANSPSRVVDRTIKIKVKER